MLHTKEEYRECLKKIIMPTLKYYTPGNAGIKCGVTGVQYGEQIARMEGFARMLWGLAPFWGGGGDYNSLVVIRYISPILYMLMD